MTDNNNPNQPQQPQQWNNQPQQPEQPQQPQQWNNQPQQPQQWNNQPQQPQQPQQWNNQPQQPQQPQQWNNQPQQPQQPQQWNNQPQQPQQPPRNYLGWAIVSTVLCFPFGIPAIINAAKSLRFNKDGNYTLAHKHASRAKKWCLWGTIVGIICFVAYIIFYIWLIVETSSKHYQYY